MFFSSDEWSLLSPHQRLLYEAIIMDNYETVTFVGKEDFLNLNSLMMQIRTSAPLDAALGVVGQTA